MEDTGPRAVTLTNNKKHEKETIKTVCKYCLSNIFFKPHVFKSQQAET